MHVGNALRLGSGTIILMLTAVNSGIAAQTAASQPSSRPSPSITGPIPEDHHSQGAEASGNDLSALSLEDLMNVEVTSVSKQKQRIADAPAAISVISQEDIDRSGMTTIPDLLRLAPGMDVGKLDDNKWAVGSRGFTGFFSTKLLVLMDGRSVYTPQFAGVYWNAQDYILQDLDRIEVIRGPGATIWGSNAVDGVVNVTSKSADQTQGWLISSLGGSQEQDGSIRYGGKLDDSTFYRAYIKYRNFDDSDTSTGQAAFDKWDSLQSGFRIDRHSNPDDTLTFQGDAYIQHLAQTDNWVNLTPPFQTNVPDDAHANGANVLARWTHVISDTSNFSVQTYYDRLHHDDMTLDYTQDTGDIEFQHNFALGSRQELIWGGGYRFYSSRTIGSSQIVFDPADRDLQLATAFIQDDVAIVPDRLHFFIGTKLEYNSYTNLEVEPSARLLWTPNSHNTLWGAISRATRTPARFEEDSQIRFAAFPAGPNTALLEATNNPDLNSEELLAYELGYRFEPTKSFSLDIAGFYNQYSNLIVNVTQTPFFDPTPPAHLVIPDALGNFDRARTYGAEVEATWRPTDNWKLIGSYSWLDGHQTDFLGQQRKLDTNSPVNQFQIRSYLDITPHVQFNTALYYAGSHNLGGVPAYTRVDANIAWHPQDRLELMVGVQNAFDNSHPESDIATFVVPTETERMYFVRASYGF